MAPLTSPEMPLPRVVSLGSSLTELGSGYTRHTHAHDELCLISDDATIITHGGRERLAPPGTLFLFRHGEIHGFRNGPNQQCRLWVIHYLQEQASYAGMPWLDAEDAEQRTWLLTRTEQNSFRALFLKLQDEHYHARPGSATAESAWLRLLIAFAGRLADLTNEGSRSALPSPHSPDPEMAAMISRLTALLADPTPLEQAIPNYDSLRHRFRRLIGRSPREWLAELRLRTACNLLLETDRPIKAIASEVGYARQHEFTRAFSRAVGVPPTTWRQNPQALP